MKKLFDIKFIFLKQVRIAILLIGLCLILVQGCQYTGHEDSFRFVFMADIHVQPELKADQGFRTAIAKVNELKPDFVITGGDLIMDALEQSYERSTNLYDLCNNLCKEFAMPVYHTIGNHEVFGLYLAVVNSNVVLSLFNGYNLKLVLQGHLHIVEEAILRNTHFITGGGLFVVNGGRGQ